ncbi:hypothetical protein AX16_003030 [Volvariella volvacea WC 439]|nr:hypothetical protein AX16_003030 [Volvariella volvacea WC 439]
MDLTHYSSTSKGNNAGPSGLTEFEILKASHKFLREDDGNEKDLNWNEQLAAKYYASLYREFAVCDLKHYKSGNFALRWRTENEVLSGAGETTCGNTRCEHHRPQGDPDELDDRSRPSSVPLTTLELPFAYQEHGENKSALVKVVLCGKCVKKLMWKRNKEREEKGQTRVDQREPRAEEVKSERSSRSHEMGTNEREDRQRDRSQRESHRRSRGQDQGGVDEVADEQRRRRAVGRERSRSPRRHYRPRSRSPNHDHRASKR